MCPPHFPHRPPELSLFQKIKFERTSNDPQFVRTYSNVNINTNKINLFFCFLQCICLFWQSAPAGRTPRCNATSDINSKLRPTQVYDYVPLTVYVHHVVLSPCVVPGCCLDQRCRCAASMPVQSCECGGIVQISEADISQR